MKFINKIMFTLLCISSIHLGAMDNKQMQKELDEKMEQLKQSMQEYQEQLNADLLDAALNGNAKKVEQLIQDGASVDAKTNLGKTPLHIAASNGHIKIVKLLLDHRASVDAERNNKRHLFISLH